MAKTALTIINDSDGKPLVRFLRRSFGHVSGYSHTLLAFLAGAEITTDRQPDASTYHGMGFLAASLIAHLTPENGDTFILAPDAEIKSDFVFTVFEHDGSVHVRCEDESGVMFESKA